MFLTSGENVCGKLEIQATFISHNSKGAVNILSQDVIKINLALMFLKIQLGA